MVGRSKNKKPHNNKSQRRKINRSNDSNPALLESSPLKFLADAQAAVNAGEFAEAMDILTDERVDAICQMWEKAPIQTDAMLALAVVFRKTGQLDRAQQWYKKVLLHGPDSEAYNELGNLFYGQGKILKAAEYYREALKVEPNRPDFCANFARATMSAGKMQEGISLLRKVVEKMPENPQVYSNYLLRLHQLTKLDKQMIFEEHKRWAQIHAPISRAKTTHNNSSEPDRRLRVGYISPDFRSHSVAYFFESLLDGHNRQMIEVYGYGNVASPDYVTEQLKNKFDHYRNICGVNYQDVGRLIERDKIDILVDLAGHAGENNLPVLSYKPAPVQVTYLGYPDTTGMEQVDYRLTDALADLPQSQKFYTEELIYLPDGFLCYRPFEFAPAVTTLPAEEKGYVTFGSFNNACKINPVIIELWAKILKAEKNSHLLLKIKDGDKKEIRDHYLHLFQQNRIAPERIEILDWLPRLEHFKLYHQVDIALDTYPYNGTTATCEALWMGVPVISLVGEHHVSRVGLSILSRVGMKSLAAENSQEYVAKAVALAAKPKEIAKTRLTMRARIAASGLCCAKDFARDIENAYRKMWHRWCESNSGEILTKPLELVGNNNC